MNIISASTKIGVNANTTAKAAVRAVLALVLTSAPANRATLRKRTPAFQIVQGAAEMASVPLPTAAYVEKDGH